MLNLALLNSDALTATYSKTQFQLLWQVVAVALEIDPYWSILYI